LRHHDGGYEGLTEAGSEMVLRLENGRSWRVSAGINHEEIRTDELWLRSSRGFLMGQTSLSNGPKRYKAVLEGDWTESEITALGWREIMSFVSSV
jgi:hypothetical protein